MCTENNIKIPQKQKVNKHKTGVEGLMTGKHMDSDEHFDLSLSVDRKINNSLIRTSVKIFTYICMRFARQ